MDPQAPCAMQERPHHQQYATRQPDPWETNKAASLHQSVKLIQTGCRQQGHREEKDGVGKPLFAGEQAGQHHGPKDQGARQALEENLNLARGWGSRARVWHRRDIVKPGPALSRTN